MLEDVWMSQDPADPGEALRWRPDLIEQGLLKWTSYSSLCARSLDAKGRMSKVLPVPREEYRQHWDTVIFDEAHYLKGRKTNWSLAAEKLSADRLFLATGTPLVNWAHEIYQPLKLLFPEKAVPKGPLGSYWRWVAQWCQVIPSQWDPNAREIGGLLPGWTWEQFAQQNNLDGHWLRRWRSDVLKDLPPLTQQVIEVSMTPDQHKIYRQLKKELYARVEETGHEIVSWSAGGVWTKLMKLTTGIEVEDANYKGTGAKLAALREILVERGHPTLVFTAYRASAERAAKVAKDAGKTVAIISGDYSLDERKTTAKLFRTGEIQVLVGTMGAMSEGLTLTAADTCIFLERDPRPSKIEQALRRIHRFGQTRPCLSIDLVANGTVDAKIRSLLTEKTDQQIAAMRAFDAIQLL
jgi:SNF2 family DNA or RNA helicase